MVPGVRREGAVEIGNVALTVRPGSHAHRSHCIIPLLLAEARATAQAFFMLRLV